MTVNDSAVLLDEVRDYLSRFVAYPSTHSLVAHALWIAHCHFMEVWESTPRIAFLSTEPASGKTRALEITETVVPRPVESVNATAAYLFRKVNGVEGLPTILYDEIDTVFGAKAGPHEEIRGLLNAGHRRGAVAGRCVNRGNIIETEELPAFCAVAIAGLGNLPDTILSRSIIVKMRRRTSIEKVEPYRRRVHSPQGHDLGERLAQWANESREGLRDRVPDLPSGVDDRAADVWEPLIVLADEVGGRWPEEARRAAVSFVSDAKKEEPSLGIHLLRDIRLVFGSQRQIFSSELVQRLNDLEEAPWGNLKGTQMDARRLAKFLRSYDIKSKQIRIGSASGKGYDKEAFWDAWQRYLQAAIPIVQPVRSKHVEVLQLPRWEVDLSGVAEALSG